MLSDFDRQNVQNIIDNEDNKFDYFTACLLRLIVKADLSNRMSLRSSYPEEVELIESILNLSSTDIRPTK